MVTTSEKENLMMSMQEKSREVIEVAPEPPSLFGLRNDEGRHRFRVGSPLGADRTVMLEVQERGGAFRAMKRCPVEDILEHAMPARVYEIDEWAELLTAWHLGLKVPISEPVYWEFMEVIPPVSMRRRVTLVSGIEVVADFLFAEGAERISAFFKDAIDGRLYVQHTTLFNRG